MHCEGTILTWQMSLPTEYTQYRRPFSYFFSQYHILSSSHIAVPTVCTSTGDLGRSRCWCFSLLEEAWMLLLLLLPLSSGSIFSGSEIQHVDFQTIWFSAAWIIRVWRLLHMSIHTAGGNTEVAKQTFPILVSAGHRKDAAASLTHALPSSSTFEPTARWETGN